MIRVIITSYKEPKATLRAVEAILKQKTSEEFEVIVVDPFPETEEFLTSKIKSKNFRFFLDPGEGKSYALNILLEENWSDNKEEIFVFTDGDVFVSENALEEIFRKFGDSRIGCVTGKPVSVDSRRDKYGYWSHFLFDGIHRARKKLSENNNFLECSGYLFAIRQGVISNFPLGTSEDSIIPYLFWKKGYKIRYAEKAEVFVKNPNNWKDWVEQKVRNIKAHEALGKIAPEMPRTKSFFNEIKNGWSAIFLFPKSLREFMWTVQIYLARIYIYARAFFELSRKKRYRDGWREREIASTKPLD